LVTEPDDIQRLCDFLSEFFEDIKVVVYLRRQDAHLASMYSQRLRRGIKSEPAYMLRGQIPGYDYAALLANWAAAFGRNAICPRLFERDTNKSFDVIDDFVEACGLLPLDKAVLEGQPLNPSMNRSGQRILREMIPYLEERDGRQFARGMSWKRLTAAVTEALPGQGWRPSQAEAAEYMKRFSDINETVRRAWFPERESLFSMDFSNLPEESIVEDSWADQLATYKLLWHLLKENVDSEAATIKKRIMSEQEAGDLPRRRGALMRVVRSNLSDLDARLELAKLLIEEGEIDQAVFNLRQVLRRAPDHQQAIDLLRELAAQSEREAAEEEAAARASVDNS
jgi:tetratricopeptide (TPR) repeat protein